MPPMQPPQNETLIDRAITWVGSVWSMVIHTIVFAAFFAASLAGLISWEIMLLVLTTAVSLEAIYLAIFIQFTVNRHTQSLREVEHDIDEIEEDIDEIQEDMEEMSEDLEEMSEDDIRDALRRRQQTQTLEKLTDDIHKVLADIEALKRRQ